MSTKEKLIRAIVKVKKCSYEQAEVIFMAAAKEWDRKVREMRKERSKCTV